MNREIPGIIKNRVKEYIYIEGRPGETFYDIAGLVAAKARGVAMPDSGGIIEQKARARLPGGKELIALSYHGDIIGWRNLYVQFCLADRRIYGFIEDSLMVLSGGEQVPLDELDFIFEY
jgi:hypothetical protein